MQSGRLSHPRLLLFWIRPRLTSTDGVPPAIAL